MFDPIVSRNFGNAFHHCNETKQRQHVHKTKGQKYKYISFQTPRNYSIPYLKEYFNECGLNNKGVRELLIHHDVPFRGGILIKKKS